MSETKTNPATTALAESQRNRPTLGQLTKSGKLAPKEIQSGTIKAGRNHKGDI